MTSIHMNQTKYRLRSGNNTCYPAGSKAGLRRQEMVEVEADEILLNLGKGHYIKHGGIEVLVPDEHVEMVGDPDHVWEMVRGKQ